MVLLLLGSSLEVTTAQLRLDPSFCRIFFWVHPDLRVLEPNPDPYEPPASCPGFCTYGYSHWILTLLHSEESSGTAWWNFFALGDHVAILDTFLFELLSFSVVLLPFASDPAFFFSSRAFRPYRLVICGNTRDTWPHGWGPSMLRRLHATMWPWNILLWKPWGGWKGHRGLRTRGSGPLWPPRFWLEGTVGLIFDLFASSRHHLSSPIPVDSQCMGTILMRRIFKKAGLRT